jgi:hypothetical protein
MVLIHRYLERGIVGTGHPTLRRCHIGGNSTAAKSIRRHKATLWAEAGAVR